MEALIEHPNKIKQISLNARKFIETRHDFISIAKAYLAHWQRKDDLDKK